MMCFRKNRQYAVQRAFLHQIALLFTLCGLFFLSLIESKAADTGPLLAIDWNVEIRENEANIQIIFDRPAPFKVLYLASPNRAIIELPQTSFGFERNQVQPIGPFENIRYGIFDEETARIVISLAAPMMVDSREDNPQSAFEISDKGAVLNLRFATVDEAQFSQTVATQMLASTQPVFAPKTDRIGEDSNEPKKVFSVVIDPGHGGVDGGAEGQQGTIEKDVTLAFGLALREALKDIPNFRVTMTRDKDQFLRLKERVRIGRQSEADLFLSIHADSIQYRSVFGATVYTLSEKASDQISEGLAEQENNADLFAGLPVDEETSDVTDILVDLMREETEVFSIRFAKSLVDKLDAENVKLIKNPHRRAGFAVLRAPDVPSILIELGYLSNKADERRLIDANWRKNLAEIMAQSIKGFGEQVLQARLQ